MKQVPLLNAETVSHCFNVINLSVNTFSSVNLLNLVAKPQR